MTLALHAMAVAHWQAAGQAACWKGGMGTMGNRRQRRGSGTHLVDGVTGLREVERDGGELLRGAAL